MPYALRMHTYIILYGVGFPATLWDATANNQLLLFPCALRTFVQWKWWKRTPNEEKIESTELKWARFIVWRTKYYTQSHSMYSYTGNSDPFFEFSHAHQFMNVNIIHRLHKQQTRMSLSLSRSISGFNWTDTVLSVCWHFLGDIANLIYNSPLLSVRINESYRIRIRNEIENQRNGFCAANELSTILDGQIVLWILFGIRNVRDHWHSPD